MIQPGAGLPPLKVVTIKLDPILDDKVEEHCFHQKRKKQDVLRDALLLYFETFRELEEAPPAQASPAPPALTQASPAQEPPEPIDKATFDLPRSLHQQLKMRAIIERRPARAILIDLLTRYLQEEVS